MVKKGKEHSCDFVEVTTGEQTFQGLLMPGSDDQKVILKLKSGYNIGINKNKIKHVKVVKKGSKSQQACVQSLEPKSKVKKHTHDKKLPTISLLHTGGTIASKVDYATGAVYSRFTPEEILGMFPELGKIANIHSRLISNMSSEDMRFGHYNTMAKEVERELKKGVDGVIITHGTDTLGYSAAALSFILEGLSKPVLLVGSQRSSDRGSSDAALNLICAAQFIVKGDYGEVGVCMHGSSSDDSCEILPGTKTRKMHTSRRDTFKAVNTNPIAKVEKDGKITYMHKTYRKKEDGKVKLRLFKENVKVGIVKSHPHMYAKELEQYKSFDGLILEGTGLGHMPITESDKLTKEHSAILKTVKRLCKKMPVVMTPQPLFGRVNMNVYTPGRTLKEAGVLGDYNDMLPETAYIKLAWLLSTHPKGKVAALVEENLRGEITKRSLQHEFPE